MFQMNDAYAQQCSLEIAKILCQSGKAPVCIDADGANDLADFIETLKERFMNQDKRSE